MQPLTRRLPSAPPLRRDHRLRHVDAACAGAAQFGTAERAALELPVRLHVALFGGIAGQQRRIGLPAEERGPPVAGLQDRGGAPLCRRRPPPRHHRRPACCATAAQAGHCRRTAAEGGAAPQSTAQSRRAERRVRQRLSGPLRQRAARRQGSAGLPAPARHGALSSVQRSAEQDDGAVAHARTENDRPRGAAAGRCPAAGRGDCRRPDARANEGGQVHLPQRLQGPLPRRPHRRTGSNGLPGAQQRAADAELPNVDHGNSRKCGDAAAGRGGGGANRRPHSRPR